MATIDLDFVLAAVLSMVGLGRFRPRAGGHQRCFDGTHYLVRSRRHNATHKPNHFPSRTFDPANQGQVAGFRDMIVQVNEFRASVGREIRDFAFVR